MKTLLFIIFVLGMFLWVTRMHGRDGRSNSWHLDGGVAGQSSSVKDQSNKKPPKKKRKKKKKPKKNLPEASVLSEKISSGKSAEKSSQKSCSEITIAKKGSKRNSQASLKRKSSDIGFERSSSIPDSSKYV